MKIVFPRLFLLSVDKKASVAEIMDRSRMEGWNSIFRRSLRSGESDELLRWQNLLAEFSGLNGYSCDKLIWTADQSNVFSVNSMYQWFDRSLRNAVDVPNFLWKNVTPMRVKFFGWLVWNGRIKSGDLLLKFGVLDDVADIRCSFCESKIESGDHVLLHCKYVHKVWTDCLKRWGMIWVTPKLVCDLLIWWQSFKFKKRKKLF